MAAEDNPDEVAEIKEWLRQLRLDRGLTQAELAAEMGTTVRTVLNAESHGQGLPRGLPFLRMLQSLGVVSDVPQEERPSVADRLAALEAQVERAGEAATSALEVLATEVAALAERLEPPGERATEGL